MCVFLKQKTAYEMRISDWSSDVCSSDLTRDSAAGSFPLLDAIMAAIVEGLSATVGDHPCPAGDRARAADRARGFVLSGHAQDVAVALIAPLRPRVRSGLGALPRRRGGDHRE